MELKLVKATEQNIDFICTVLELNFIPEERRANADTRRVLSDDRFCAWLVVKNGISVGIATVWSFNTFAYLEHLAILEEYRNGGLGAQTIEALKERYQRLVLEVEPPVEPIQKRRIAFYERCGFSLCPVPYFQPPYQKGLGGVELMLMSYPDRLFDFDTVIATLYSEVYDYRPSHRSYDLTRFYKAHMQAYDRALAEIKNGKKQSHWMWYIFPQIVGLGKSFNSEKYAIRSLDEAKAFCNDKYLGENLLKIIAALQALDTSDPVKVMGYTDSVKLRSSMTLFALAADDPSPYLSVLNKYFNGKKDGRTLSILYQKSKKGE